MKPSRLYLVLFTLLLVLGSGCKKPAKVYLVPIGDAPMAEINDLVSHYREKFGITVEVLPAMHLDETTIDSQRQQLIAENVAYSMLRGYSDYRMNPGDVLIGITGQDMYPRSEGWQFCFGWRLGEQRAAVVSTARMALHYLGEPLDEAVLRKRLRKVVTKDIGLLYYEKSDSDNPRSVLYNNIMGIEELDYVTENF